MGKPFVEVARRSRPWAAVRHWLHDLAQELDAGAKDGTLRAEFGLDSIWITAQGRALLLDECWPALPATPRFAWGTGDGVQGFLDAVANAAVNPNELPLHARTFLRNLAAGGLDRTSFIIGNLRSLLSKPASLSRRRRLASILVGPMLLAAPLLAALVPRNRPLDLKALEWASPPGVSQLPTLVHYQNPAYYDFKTRSFIKQQPDPKFAEHVAIYIAAHFGEFIRSAEFNRHPGVAGLTEEKRALLIKTAAAHPHISAERLAVADAAVNRKIEAERLAVERARQNFPRKFGPVMFMGYINFLAAAGLFSVVVFGTTAGLRVFGLAVVNRAGEPASRGRMAWRTGLIWVPALVAAGPIGWVSALGRSGGSISPILVGVMVTGAAVFAAGLIWTVIRPGRGPQDILSGTRVVMR
jgi:hypothetical protein